MSQTLTLTPLGDDEFAEFLDLAVAGYAHDCVAAGRWLEAEAPSLARAESEQLLPQGAGTPDQFLYAMSVRGVPGSVGYLWFATAHRGSAKVAYVYQVVVKPAHRRRGHAGAALRQLEAIAKARGHTAMVLNVFAHNTAAQALYRSLGYAVSNMTLAKPLGLS